MTETVVGSATREVAIGFDRPFVVIGERINPTGRKLLAGEMKEGDYRRVEADALLLEQRVARRLAGADADDVERRAAAAVCSHGSCSPASPARARRSASDWAFFAIIVPSSNASSTRRASCAFRPTTMF